MNNISPPCVWGVGLYMKEQFWGSFFECEIYILSRLRGGDEDMKKKTCQYINIGSGKGDITGSHMNCI